MSWRLRTYEINPPGGYPYIQSTGIYKEFPTQPLITAQAQIVANFRQGNGLPRSSFAQVLQAIDCQTCARLGNDPQWCINTDAPFSQTIAQIPGVTPCKACGAVV